MKRLFLFIAALLILLSCAGCTGSNQKNKDLISGAADAELMLRTIERITDTSRQYGEKEIELSKQFIFDTLVGYGYEVSKQEFTHELEEVILLDGYAETDPDELIEGKHYEFADVTRTGHNIVAIKYPESVSKKDDILIVSAHYDSAMDCPGANDNGSGVAVLLEIARLLKDLPSSIELRIIAFDGEEAFLMGSHYYVDGLSDEELSRIIGVINFDMFASKDMDGLQMTTIDGRHNYLSEMFGDFKLRDMKSSSDHISFVSAAIPVVSISHELDSFNHKPEDTLERIDKEKLVVAANKGVEVISGIMSFDSPPYIKDIEIDSDRVFSLDLSGRFPFFENIQKVEEELGITPVQIPVKDTMFQQVILDYVASVEWWGEPLETHFIYDFMTLSDSMLSYIKIILNDTQRAKDTLDSNFEHIKDVESYTFYIEYENITEAWLNDENAFIVRVNNGHAELVIVPYDKQKINTNS